jgi:hypothetical protein
MPFLVAVLMLSATSAQSIHPAVSSVHGITQVPQKHSGPLKSPLTHGPEISVSGQIAYQVWKDERLGVALPHILRFPDPDVMMKVNEALGRELENRRQAVVECMGEDEDEDEGEQDSGRRSWEEQDSVSLFTADVLSVVRRSDYYCGGNHPDTALEPLVYDLHTGKTLDLKDLFKAQEQSAPLADGTVPDGPSHRLLFQLFLRHYKTPQGCADVMSPETTLKIFFTSQGLVIAPELAHAIQSCGEEILIPYAELRTHLKAPWRFAGSHS